MYGVAKFNYQSDWDSRQPDLDFSESPALDPPVSIPYSDDILESVSKNVTFNCTYYFIHALLLK